MSEKINTKKIYYIKIILLGETGVGKTNLINIYLDKEYNDYEMPTTDSNQSYKTIKIKNNILKITFWDTMGQERHRAITKSFIKGSNIVIFVYDITRRETFLELNYWINTSLEILENEEVIFGISANKSDLFFRSEVNKEEGEQYANNINALFSETSAKKNPDGFKIFVEELLEKLISNPKIFEKIDQDIYKRNSFYLKNNINKIKQENTNCCI